MSCFGCSVSSTVGFTKNRGGWSDNNNFPRMMADVNGDRRADIVGFGSNDIFTSLAATNWTTPTVINPPSSSIMTQAQFDNWPNLSAYTTQNPFPWKGQNCTWYAHGRMLQLGYSKSALDTMLGNAGNWDNTAARGAVVVSRPQAPSIALWEAGVGGAGSVGHVAVVERVNSDGSIVISESNWNGRTYNTRTIHPGTATWPSKFITVPRA
ncbi:MAG: CHAP domain-containing protein [Leptolyngbya sp. DLM2.Bin15]|nr:MAG: CHAP domain-containing protein [Leptolyngbya sp. DLM2.Bin15]